MVASIHCIAQLHYELQPVFLSGEVRLDSCMSRCGSAVLLATKFFEVAEFTAVTPLDYHCQFRINFGRLLSVLKSNNCHVVEYLLWFLIKSEIGVITLSFFGACTIKITHRRQLSLKYDVL
jgi:hypothetical protein